MTAIGSRTPEDPIPFVPRRNVSIHVEIAERDREIVDELARHEGVCRGEIISRALRVYARQQGIEEKTPAWWFWRK